MRQWDENCTITSSPQCLGGSAADKKKVGVDSHNDASRGDNEEPDEKIV